MTLYRYVYYENVSYDEYNLYTSIFNMLDISIYLYKFDQT